MKLESAVELIVTCRQYGGTNIARIQGEGVSASATMSTETAVKRAVEKLIARNQWGECNVNMIVVNSTVSFSELLVNVSPKDPEIVNPKS